MTRDRAYWASVHIRGDRAEPFERRHVSLRPFWKPLWVEQELERKALLARRKAA